MKLPIGSYSFYNTLENCPHQAYHRYVAKTLPYVESPEMAWGNKVHAALEHRIKSGVTLPDEMVAAEGLAKQFHDMGKVSTNIATKVVTMSTHLAKSRKRKL